MKKAVSCLFVIVALLICCTFLVQADGVIFEEKFFDIARVEEVKGQVIIYTKKTCLDPDYLTDGTSLNQGDILQGFRNDFGGISGAILETKGNSTLKIILTPQYKFGQEYFSTINLGSNTLINLLAFNSLNDNEIVEWENSWEKTNCHYRILIEQGKINCNFGSGFINKGDFYIEQTNLFWKVMPEPGQDAEFFFEMIKDVQVDLKEYPLAKELIAGLLEQTYSVRSIDELEDDWDKEEAEALVRNFLFGLKSGNEMGRSLDKVIVSVKKGSVKINNINPSKILFHDFLNSMSFQFTIDESLLVKDEIIINAGETREFILVNK